MPNWKKVITSGSNAHLNHITASGNISSSGHFIGTHKGVGSGAANKVFFEGDGGPAKLASKDQSTTYLNFGQNSLGIVANGEDTFNVNDDGLVRVGTNGESHGTKALQVHGDISCSGNIHLEPGNINQTVFVTTGSAGTDTIRFGIGTAKGEIPGTALTVSGSISSSGFVSASSFSGDGSGLTNVSATVSPAGSDTQVQFNDGGSLGGDSGLVYNKTSDTLTTTNIGAFNLTGKLTAGSTEIEGSAFDINGGVIDQTTIGGSTAAAGTFTLLTGTNITASGDISASGTITTDKFKANLEAGVDNSVLIKDADGFIKTDEIDERVWSNGQLLSGDGGALSDGYIPYTSDGDSGLLDTSNLYWDSNKLGIGGGAVTPPKTLTVTGDISSSGAINTLSHITASGNISGSSTSTFKIGGKLQAGSKSFLIDRPEGGKLEYGALEGQQNDVFYRGELKGDNTIYLPQEWEWLVDTNTITTQLTSIGQHQELFVKEIKENKIFIDINGMFKTKENIHCYYIIHGTRKDIELIRNYQ